MINATIKLSSVIDRTNEKKMGSGTLYYNQDEITATYKGGETTIPGRKSWEVILDSTEEMSFDHNIIDVDLYIEDEEIIVMNGKAMYNGNIYKGTGPLSFK